MRMRCDGKTYAKFNKAAGHETARDLSHGAIPLPQNRHRNLRCLARGQAMTGNGYELLT